MAGEPEPKDTQPQTPSAEGDGTEPKKGKAPAWMVQDPDKGYEALQDARTEAADRRREIKELKDRIAATETSKLKEQGEYKTLAEQLQAKLNTLQNDLKTEQLNSLRVRVANEFQLPQMLALRLQGDDEEALRKDAEALAASLPKGATTTAPGAPGVKPGGTPSQGKTTGLPGGQPAQETDDQRRRRLYGPPGGSVFAGTGDVVINTKQGSKSE